MLRLDNEQPSLWESVLPPELFEMSEELTKIDRILDDERFFALFRGRFYTRVGSEVNPLKLDQIRPPIVYSEMLS